MLAIISSGWASAIVALAALGCTLLIALVTAVWRIGTKVGGIASTLAEHDDRMDRIEVGQRAHDQWHMSRGIV